MPFVEGSFYFHNVIVINKNGMNEQKIDPWEQEPN